jgi:DNA recombination protein RmuC
MSTSTILLIVSVSGSLAACALVNLVLFRLNHGLQGLSDFSISLKSFETVLLAIAPTVRDENRMGRDELRSILGGHLRTLENRLTGFGQHQTQLLGSLRTGATEGRNALEEALGRKLDVFAGTQARNLGETNQAMHNLAERLEKAQAEARKVQKDGLDAIAAETKELTESNFKRQEVIRETLNANLEQMRKDNEAKLEQMRATVDEKLQGTLETRLGESFKLVSKQLEEVHRGLGEMQTLATGVGDLKRVLTNVKSRGGWGEVQLGMLLEDLLTVDQYAKNVHIPADSREVVEFAVRLPGKTEAQPIYLPIDSKFPNEDYERLLTAQESGIPDEVEKAAQALEKAVRNQAKTISEKYVHPPHSTDFAIMYLPTEGLFAEVVRRPGLCSDIQAAHRVMLTGPTTLAALLTSLQLGFRTLAIEKRSSEVWQVLSAAKAEFRKYGDVWDKLGKQLDTARKTVEEASQRTRAVERKLRDVETTGLPASSELPPPPEEDDGEEAA